MKTAWVGLAIMLLAARTFADTTYVSGTVTGTWTRDHSPIIATGDLVVGDTLIIEPGVHVLFEPGNMLTVLGRLDARGWEADSILFTCASLDTHQRWGGIRFNHPTIISELRYCTVQRVNVTASLNGGRGFLIDNAYVRAFHCSLRDCRTPSGSAVALRNGGRVDMTDCVISDNGMGGGAAGGLDVIVDCTANLTRCRIAHNQTMDGAGIRVYGGTLNLVDCDFDSNHANIWGGALFISDSSDVTAMGCTFRHNHGMVGGAIYQFNQYSGVLRLTKCLFYDNEADLNYNGQGGAVNASGTAKIVQCTIAGNRAVGGGGIYASNSDTINSTIIAFNSGGGVSGGASTNVRYCDIFGNTGGSDHFPDSSNIYLDPQFYDSVASYYLTRNSPCIDAGDPTLPNDLDNTRADIGAFYYDQSASATPRESLPSSFSLLAYPNPFNSTVRLTFTLPHAGTATLTIFDILGRETALLVNERLTAGEFTHLWNALSASTGVYFAVLRSDDNTVTQKLLLLK